MIELTSKEFSRLIQLRAGTAMIHVLRELLFLSPS